MTTVQEEFWKGEFGDQYIDRNNSIKLLSSNINLFSKILNSTGQVTSILELGCNIGMNLRALRHLLPENELSGVEINKKAVAALQHWGGATAIEGSILDIDLKNTYDLTLIKGVLIHINPDRLNDVYTRLYDYSNKYICIAEYYNPSPVEIPYRGHTDRLYKRDFAGEIMDKYSDLILVNYGFAYHRDPLFPQDDITWFLMKKGI